jgi:hypothetical protein
MKLKLLQDYIKLGLSRLQTASQVALGHRATMLCKCPQNTILVISWQESFPPVLKAMDIFPRTVISSNSLISCSYCRPESGLMCS